MKRIAFPLKPEDAGPDVGNLQDALRLMLDRGALWSDDPAARQEMAAALRKDRERQIYGSITCRLVGRFQTERRLQATGQTDEPTATAMNALLKEWGVLDAEPGPEPVRTRSFAVGGKVRREDGSPLSGMRVRACHESSPASLRLGEDDTDWDGGYTIRYESLPDGAEICLRVTVLAEDGKVLQASSVIRGPKPMETVDLVVPGAALDVFRVGGRVSSRLSAAVEGLRVSIVDLGVGAEVELASVLTGRDGVYRADLSGEALQKRGKACPDLQARVYGGGICLGMSDVRYNASRDETLDVTLEDSAVRSMRAEHTVLTGDLGRHWDGRLGDLQESAERHDVTFLANKTGWDARAVALAALADRFSARSSLATNAAPIPSACFYALFRAGLPANEETIFHTPPGILARVWKEAAGQGVMEELPAEQIRSLVGRFADLSARKMLTGPAAQGVSPLGEMLAVSGLDGTGQDTFARLWAEKKTDLESFWKAVSGAFGPEVAKRLELDGRLAYLTFNNARLMGRIHAAAGQGGLADPLELARMGYYRPEAWEKLLAEDIPVPAEIPGDSPGEKRARYSGYMAAHIRLAYPTACLAGMLGAGEMSLPGAEEGVVAEVLAFLQETHGQFEIGVHPVVPFVVQNGLRVSEEALGHLKKLQRLYQISPGDRAMAGLLRLGVDSALQVVRQDRETFARRHGTDVGGADVAGRIWDRSAMIHGAVLNVALGYLTASRSPSLGARRESRILDPAPEHAGDVIAYATMESLFGSMDYCACDQCRSILSPAAYLVDLLLFLDHPGPEAGENPQDVLLERRPDIQHLPLSCENTNTAMPYIDVVNETLEYFLAHNPPTLSLDGFQGYDTAGVSSEDLLASPQNVMDSAYAILRDACFPLPLPFHRPLENLRRLFGKFGVSLSQVLERLCATGDLERGTHPYAWRDIWMEEAGFSRMEYRILTDSVAVPLWRMYGLEAGTPDGEACRALSNAKEFTGRVGISWDELVALLRTRFVNPNSALIPRLERLGVSFAVLAALRDGTLSDHDFDALLAAHVPPPDPADFGGDPSAPKTDFTPIRNWVKDASNYTRIMGLVTLAIPTLNWAPNRTFQAGDCVRTPSSALDSSLYCECTVSGQSAGSPPDWPRTAGGTCTDGTVTWVCRDLASGQGFANLAFRYADPARLDQPIGVVEYMRLLRFVRLWRKTGWTLAQTDDAVCALFPRPSSPDRFDEVAGTVPLLDAGFLACLPGVGVLMRAMGRLGLSAGRDLQALLACWSDIGTHGDGSLYRRMFLTPSILKQDAVFAENSQGGFLADATIRLGDHAEALRSAFGLSGEDYGEIVSALGYDSGTSLSIPAISAIFRFGWLARRLKLSVREFRLLTECAGLDPFSEDHPADSRLLRLIGLVQALRDRSVRTAAALYLFWNQDLSGKSSPRPETVVELGRALRSDFAGIEDQFSATGDSEEAGASSRMALVYGQEASDAFFGLLAGTTAVDAACAPLPVPLVTALAGADPCMAWDPIRHRLSRVGLLEAAMQASLGALPDATPEFRDALEALHARSEEIRGLFFTRYPELEAPFVQAVAKPLPERVRAFLALFQPGLARMRKRQQALQRLGGAAGVGEDFTRALLDPKSGHFPIHSAADPGRPGLDDALDLETAGLSVKFLFRDTATGPVDLARPAEAVLSYDRGGGNPLPGPGIPISGVWSGQIEPQESGFHNFVIHADATATVHLSLEGQPAGLTRNGNVWRNTAAIELRAGVLLPFELRVEKVKDVMSLEWETPTRSRQAVPARLLWPPEVFEPFSETWVRFLKSATLAGDLGLGASEMAHFALHEECRVGGAGLLDALPAGTGAPSSPGMLEPLMVLLDYVRVRKALAQDDTRFIDILRDPLTASLNASSLLPTLSRWDMTSLDAVLVRFGMVKQPGGEPDRAALGSMKALARVADAFELAARMGIPVERLLCLAGPDPSGETLRNLQSALRARYESSDWRDVVRPVNDGMRGIQRDALVACILHQMKSHASSAHIDTPDRLFEYFLMDVQMEPCMQTSRIRHAISSVQLFVERCLLNLEARVSPGSIDGKQWEWMKRYRIWEANRKVFLYPENWLEPELRDNKSPFFREIESELLQGDITEDAAAAVLLKYLGRLEEVARLEPCGLFDMPADEARRKEAVTHVVARTAGANRKYFYRRRESGIWTPWEPIPLDIEDRPVVPVVWKDRLLLFWLRILKEGPTTVAKPFEGTVDKLTDLKASNISATTPSVTIRAVLCWSEYQNGKWQPARTSDINSPQRLTWTSGLFDRASLRLHTCEEGDCLRVSVEGGGWTTFLLANTHGLPVKEKEGTIILGLWDLSFRYFDTSRDPFSICYCTAPGGLSAGYGGAVLNPTLLTNGMLDRTVETLHPHPDSWNAPFFYEDDRHTFFVTTGEEYVTVPGFGKYGLLGEAGLLDVHAIPNLVFGMEQEAIARPGPWGGGPMGPDPGVVEESPVRRFVTEDAYIDKGIGTTAAVPFDGMWIGPSRPIGTVRRER